MTDPLSPSGAKIQPWKKGLTYQEYYYSLKIYAEDRGLDHCLDPANRPAAAPERMPVATTPAVFLAKVKPRPEWMELLGYQTVGARNAFDEDDFDEDVAEQWAELVQENREAIKEHKEKLKTCKLNMDRSFLICKCK